MWPDSSGSRSTSKTLRSNSGSSSRNRTPWWANQLHVRAFEDFINDFPLPLADRQALISLHNAPKDYLPGKSTEEKTAHLETTSYRDFLLKDVGLSEQAVKYFQNRTNDFMGLSIDAVAAYDAYYVGYPGFGAMNLEPLTEEALAEIEEPYIYHFPDGNASLARLLVRSLIPAVAPGHTMDDIVLVPFDYAKLDQPKTQVRIRLNSTAVSVRNVGNGVNVGYSRGGHEHPKDPTQPIGLHMVYVPTSPNSGMNARDQARAGRGRLYGQSFEVLEAQLRDQLQRMLGPGGFNHQTDILDITVNRWSHGYACFSNSLYDDSDESEKLMNLARQPVGHVSIANSDAAWSAYAHAAIDEAYRAVREVA